MAKTREDLHCQLDAALDRILLEIDDPEDEVMALEHLYYVIVGLNGGDDGLTSVPYVAYELAMGILRTIGMELAGLVDGTGGER